MHHHCNSEYEGQSEDHDETAQILVQQSRDLRPLALVSFQHRLRAERRSRPQIVIDRARRKVEGDVVAVVVAAGFCRVRIKHVGQPRSLSDRRSRRWIAVRIADEALLWLVHREHRVLQK